MILFGVNDTSLRRFDAVVIVFFSFDYNNRYVKMDTMMSVDGQRSSLTNEIVIFL